MNRKRILSLLLAIVMITALFAACGDSKDPATTTPAPDVTSTSDQTSDSAPGSGDTTPSPEAGYNGYEFVLANPGNAYVDNPTNALEEELMDIYAQLEDELDVSFSAISIDAPETALLANAMAEIKLADFIRCKQNAWVPAAVNNAIRPLNSSEVLETGMNVNDENQFDQVYTQLATIRDGNIWGCEMSGKYYITGIGFTYVFNKPLLEQNGYPAETIYEKVRNYEWTWEYFMEIAAKVTKDTDGDGQNDIHGQTMVDIESELESNGIGLMYFNEETNKWASGFATPQLVEALEFVLTIATDPQYSLIEAPDNNYRRQVFYDGQAAFGCLYGGHYGKDGVNAMCEFDYGIVPIPKGPQAEKYSYVIPDLNVFVVQTANKDWATSCAIMAKLAEQLTDKEEAGKVLRGYLRDDESLEVLENYCFPGARIQATRFSPDIKAALDAAAELISQVGPAAAVETVNNNIQTAIDQLFGY
ncbi:MAG: hypothetical protein DBY36_07210 [Clostridiales bacterium]|nr:MAG: hypothetical protein DBY36_07210 [Clostridiales bacterium]